MRRALSGVVSLLLLSSCASGRKQSAQNTPTPLLQKDSKKARRASLAAIKIQEAKQADIPIPLSAKPLSHHYYVDADRVMLGYRDTTLSSEDLISYYEQEMERLGWRSIFAVMGTEAVLQFEKPGRLCIVSIRPQSGGRSVEWVVSAGFFIDQ